MKQINKFDSNRAGVWISRKKQHGGLTIFSAILILILMTTVMVYATRSSVFESRISANEVSQKVAFDIAEAAADQGMMYILANSNAVLSSRENVFPDGTAGSFTKDGWFAPGGAKWVLCPANPGSNHPCGGDVPAKAGSYYYDTDGDTATIESLPITQSALADRTARMSALLCFVDINDPVANCGAPVGTVEEESNSTLMITLLSYGYSDCTNVNDVSTCTGEARVAMPIGTDKVLAGSPTVPLVAKSTVPLDGTFEVVGNPNGGGVGVPLTTWMKSTSNLLSSGTWQTCEMEEWYHTTEQPEGVACTDNNCLCGPGGNDTTHFLSWKKGGDTNISIDIIQDPNFPADLFDFYFGVPRTDYMKIKGTAKQITAASCSSLGPSSSGLIWVNGASCSINGNTTVGSPLAPVILVSAANLTTVNAGSKIFGVLYIFDDDPAGSTAEFKATGGATVYGAAIIDGEIDKLQGTFQIVYNSAVLATAAGVAGVGAVNGGWRDFGLPDIAW